MRRDSTPQSAIVDTQGKDGSAERLLYKGARLTQVLPEVSKMMEHYLSKSGQSLRVSDRIFTRNRTVEDVKRKLLEQIFSFETLRTSYTSEEFHMADPANLDSVFGLYYGHLIAVPIREKDGLPGEPKCRGRGRRTTI